MAEEKGIQDLPMSASNEEFAKALERNPNDWSETPEDTRDKVVEWMFWRYIQKTNPMPTPPKSILPEAPSRRWWIESPQVVEAHEPGYLCEVCQHIDFGYLIHSPLEQSLEEIALATLQWVLESHECSFCRLVLSTIKSALAKPTISTQYEGKDVMCTLRTLPMDMAIDGPREIILNTLNLPEGIVNYRKSSIHSFDSTVDFSLPNCGRPAQSPLIDCDLVKQWYTNCLNGMCSLDSLPVRTNSLPKGFRVIDVQRYCIVDAAQDCRYVALSYVWGNATTLQNAKDIKEDLGLDNALQDRMEELPNTIKDAISFTNKIGERYLWVDSLCIIQDDPEDKTSQIAAMDLIYSSAALTIAVTSGDSANAGFSGMSAGPRRFEQHFANVQGICLANRPFEFSLAVNDSAWDTRAWTLQERVLSPRTLFVAEQRCFSLATAVQTYSWKVAIPSGMGNLLPSSRSVNIVSYRRLVQTYTSRRLTHPSDILNAFKGIEARFRPLFRSDFVFGLPRSELDSQLLWQPTGALTRRRDPKTGLPLFPSWSWTGWIGEIQCDWAENLSRIEWLESNGERYSGKDFRYPAGANRDVMKRTSYRLEWRGELEEDTGAPYYFEKKKNPDEWFFHPTAPEEERILGPNLKDLTNHLVFEAETIESHTLCLGHYWSMAISDHKCTDENHTMCPLPLRDPEGYLGGYIMLPGERFVKFRDDLANGSLDVNDYEYIMLSRGKTSQQKDRGEDNPDLLVDSEAIAMEKILYPDRPHVDVATEACGFDQQRYDAKKPWCVYNIMLIEWKDGIAYRLGVGKMHIDAWAQAKPKKKIIELG